MKKELEPCFQEMLQKFFLERMMKQRKASPETIKSYRDTFRLYIQYLMDKSGVIP